MNPYNPNTYTYTYVIRYSVVLKSNPTSSNEASTHQYLTDRKASIATTSLTGSAKFLASTMPTGFTGDATVTVGSPTVFKLPNVCAAGTYTKAVINAKGIITAGTTLTVSDLFGLVSFNKITSGKPTTVSGYGISDAYSTTANLLTGAVSISYTPTAAGDLVSKQYITTAVAAIPGEHAVGDVFMRSLSTTPAKMLKCNGAAVSKTTYASLYAVISNTFTRTTTPGSGKPWAQQFTINTSHTAGDITGWQTNGSLPVGMQDQQVIVTKNRVYLLGGSIGGSRVSTVYTTTINPDGTLGSWVTSTSLPTPMSAAHSIVTKSRVYIMGGIGGSGGLSRLANVYYATINTDGTIGAWTTGTSLPNNIYSGQLFITSNRVYILAGWIGGSRSAITYTAPVDSNGVIGAWTAGTSLPAKISAAHVVVTKNRVYLISGRVDNVVSTNVYTSTFDNTGVIGTWSIAAAMPTAVEFSTIFATKSRVYLIAGANTSLVPANAVSHAPINADGTLGTWVSGTSFPVNLSRHALFATSTRLYILGGLPSSGGSSSTIYSVMLSGGLNDYSQYYDGTYRAAYSTEFTLPDYTSIEKTGKYFYIKYM